MYYARVLYETNASAAEKHDDVTAARRWIEQERSAKPESFRLGQIFDDKPDLEVLAICDPEGWR